MSVVNDLYSENFNTNILPYMENAIVEVKKEVVVLIGKINDVVTTEILNELIAKTSFNGETNPFKQTAKDFVNMRLVDILSDYFVILRGISVRENKIFDLNLFKEYVDTVLAHWDYKIDANKLFHLLPVKTKFDELVGEVN